MREPGWDCAYGIHGAGHKNCLAPMAPMAPMGRHLALTESVVEMKWIRRTARRGIASDSPAAIVICFGVVLFAGSGSIAGGRRGQPTLKLSWDTARQRCCRIAVGLGS